MKYIDAHCHIDLFENEDIDKVSKEVDFIYGVSVSYESSLKVLDLSKKYPNIKAALGIHPEHFEFYDEFQKLKELIIQNKKDIYAIGEVGLPYFSLFEKNASDKKNLYNKGLELFEKFVILAKELSLPLVLHATEFTALDAYNLLTKYEIKNAMFHWLSCDLNTANLIFNSGYFASVSLDILYNKKYFEFVKHIPLKNLLIESDSPWKYDDNKSRPKDIKRISPILAPIHNLEEKYFLEVLSENMDIFLKI